MQKNIKIRLDLTELQSFIHCNCPAPRCAMPYRANGRTSSYILCITTVKHTLRDVQTVNESNSEEPIDNQRRAETHLCWSVRWQNNHRTTAARCVAGSGRRGCWRIEHLPWRLMRNDGLLMLLMMPIDVHLNRISSRLISKLCNISRPVRVATG